MKISIQIKKLSDDAVVPVYQSKEAAGFDFHSIEDKVLEAGERGLIKTGLSMALSFGYELQIRPRSGLAFKHGLTVLNAPGTVDSDYRGEVMVLLINHGTEAYKVAKGERIAQGVIQEVTQAKFSVVDELEDTDRGVSGFGSTGK